MKRRLNTPNPTEIWPARCSPILGYSVQAIDDDALDLVLSPTRHLMSSGDEPDMSGLSRLVICHPATEVEELKADAKRILETG